MRVFGRKTVAGSVVGGIAETQEVIDYCTARNIKVDIEFIGPEDVNWAFERVVNKDVLSLCHRHGFAQGDCMTH